MSMHYERLLKNIEDQIVELQIKLGYAKEVVRLYYPVSSLNGILGLQEKDTAAMLKKLSSCRELSESPLGKLVFSCHQERLEVGVSSAGVEYVHEHVEPTAFLRELIGYFQSHHMGSMEEVREIFEKYSPDYVCEKMPEGTDFDYVLYFPGSDVDEYYYCMKEEMGHLIYHRFMKEDYRLLMEDSL